VEQKIIGFINTGYLDTKNVDGVELNFLTTPCRFRIDEKIITDLKRNYKTEEEIGGVLWAKPTTKDTNIIYLIDKVSYFINAIEYNPRADHRNKTNAYLPDKEQRQQILYDLFSQGYLPLEFHSHPVKGTDFLQSLTKPDFNAETSQQDKVESFQPYTIGKKRLLMPRVLVVGNDTLSRDIFIGVYNGFIAPKEFENSKKKIQQENFDKIIDLVSMIKLSDGQKLGFSIGVALLLFTIAKYPRYSWPVIIGLGATLPLLMTNTENLENPNYFCKLSFGSAEIFIPKTA
jgi:hypothetical protein